MLHVLSSFLWNHKYRWILTSFFCLEGLSLPLAILGIRVWPTSHWGLLLGQEKYPTAHVELRLVCLRVHKDREPGTLKEGLWSQQNTAISCSHLVLGQRNFLPWFASLFLLCSLFFPFALAHLPQFPWIAFLYSVMTGVWTHTVIHSFPWRPRKHL